MSNDDNTHQQFDDVRAMLDDVQEAMRTNVLKTTTIDPRMRRLARALDDLGLPVPDDWATVELDADGVPVKVDFASMSWKTLDRLVCCLEDLAEARPITVIRPMGGPTLFDIDPSPAPTPAPRSTTLHISVPV